MLAPASIGIRKYPVHHFNRAADHTMPLPRCPGSPAWVMWAAFPYHNHRTQYTLACNGDGMTDLQNKMSDQCQAGLKVMSVTSMLPSGFRDPR